MTSDRRRWVLLAYRVPREPSTPRIAVWRKLRRLGVAQIVDGLVAVPHSVANLEQMGWVANDILDAGGEAQLWTAELNSAKQERELVARLNREVAEAYRDFVDAAEEARGADSFGPRALARFRRELRDIVRRDHLGATGRDRAERALQRLSRAAAVV
jgi:Protein ChrB, N-terminal